MLRIGNTKTINKDVIGRHFFVEHLHAIFTNFDNRTIVRHENFFFREPILYCQISRFFEEVVVGVDRNIIIRFGLFNHVHNIAACGMAGDVHVHEIAMNDIVGLAIDRILETLDCAFVARNDGR